MCITICGAKVCEIGNDRGGVCWRKALGGKSLKVGMKIDQVKRLFIDAFQPCMPMTLLSNKYYIYCN